MNWPTFKTPPSVAFFDVDGTLLAETTTFLYAKILQSRGMIDRGFMIRAVYHGFQHKLGNLDYASLVNFGLKSIVDIPVIELERIAYENFAQNVKPRLYEGVLEHVLELRRGGTPVVLVSSSPGIVIQPLSLYLGCEDIITTPVRFERNRLVGLGEGPPCYGEGKLHWATQWAEARKISMDEAAAYADNWSDRALLERVGHAFVVRPHRKLRRLAKAKGWPIIEPRIRPREKSRAAASDPR